MRDTLIRNQSAPSATIVPVLVYADATAALTWLCETFGFEERLRLERDGVVLHAQLVAGDGAIMLGRQGGMFRPPRRDEVSQYVHVAGADVDLHHARARERGAQIVHPPIDQLFGERQYTVDDPEGHRWTFSQHIADVLPQAWGATTAKV